MKKVWQYILLIILSGFFIYYYLDFVRCSKYSCILFNDKNNYVLEEEYEDAPKVYRAMLKNGTIRIRIETYAHTSKEEAASYDKIKVMNIESLYETAKSPYPGALSNEIDCGKDYRPQIGKLAVNGVPSTYIQGYLNDRFQYGTCLKEELEYRSSLVLFHCPSQKKWYQFELITSLADPVDDKRILGSLTCK